jgi:hypothetical protein
MQYNEPGLDTRQATRQARVFILLYFPRSFNTVIVVSWTSKYVENLAIGARDASWSLGTDDEG